MLICTFQPRFTPHGTICSVLCQLVLLVISEMKTNYLWNSVEPYSWCNIKCCYYICFKCIEYIYTKTTLVNILLLVVRFLQRFSRLWRDLEKMRERMMIGIKVRHSSIMLVRKKEREFFFFLRLHMPIMHVKSMFSKPARYTHYSTTVLCSTQLNHNTVTQLLNTVRQK